jgi:hypothetical protein
MAEASVNGWNDRERSSGGGAYSDPPGGMRLPRRQPSHQEGEQASHTYEAERFQQVLLLLSGLAIAVIGIVGLVAGEIEALFALFGGIWLLLLGILMAHRVTLDDDGVYIEAIGRRVRIPWDELQSVAPPPWDFQHLRLRWRRRRGLGVTTPQAFPDLHRMLTEIEQRAPHVYVAS